MQCMKMITTVSLQQIVSILRIINLAKLRDITPEQQYNLNEHNQELELEIN